MIVGVGSPYVRVCDDAVMVRAFGLIVTDAFVVVVAAMWKAPCATADEMTQVPAPVIETVPVEAPTLHGPLATEYVTAPSPVPREAVAETLNGESPYVFVNEVTANEIVRICLRVIVVVDVVVADAPVLPAASIAPPAANSGRTVPPEHPVIVTVRLVPESVPGSNEQSVAEPVFEKSSPVIPVTDSENVIEYVSDVRFVGVASADVKVVMVGITPSTM